MRADARLSRTACARSATSATRASTRCATAAREAHSRSFADRRTGRFAASCRKRSDAASAPQRGLSRRRLRSRADRTTKNSSSCEDSVRSGRGAAAVQRRPERPLSSVAIAGIIARYAGDPDGVRRALIDRANEAGGKDNVSIIYIEGSAFAAAPKSKSRADLKPVPRRRGPPRISRDFRRDCRGKHGFGRERRTARPRRRNASPSRASIARDALAAVRTRIGSRPSRARRGRVTPAAAQCSGTRPAWNASSARNLVGRDRNSESSAMAEPRGRVHRGPLAGVGLAIGVAYYMRDMLIPVVPLRALRRATHAVRRPARSDGHLGRRAVSDDRAGDGRRASRRHDRRRPR